MERHHLSGAGSSGSSCNAPICFLNRVARSAPSTDERSSKEIIAGWKAGLLFRGSSARTHGLDAPEGLAVDYACGPGILPIGLGRVAAHCPRINLLPKREQLPLRCEARSAYRPA